MTARLVAALPIVATVAFVATLGAITWSAGSTLGYDFQAYLGAGERLLHGQPLYDPSVTAAGGFAIFYYPPTFALAVTPFAVIGGQLATWAWTAALIAAFLVGLALLPVSATVRWGILLLAALDWPFLYAIKLGQVGPILFLLFAIGWRSLDRPTPLGVSIALGALIKVQPVLLLGWAALTSRWRAFAIGVVTLAIGGLVAAILLGPAIWFGFRDILLRVSEPLTTPHNFTPGAIAVDSGASLAAASVIQLATTVAALVAVVVASRFAAADASYLVTIVASQLISPLLWDHYAMLLLLPVAWLLERRQWWAVAIPLATSVVLVGIVPPIVYPVVFAVCLVAPAVVGWRHVGVTQRPAGVPS